jgi:outer membrane lipoprotein carrier protein
MGRQKSAYQWVGVVGVWTLWLLPLGLYTAVVGEAGQGLGPDAVVARVQSRYERTTRLQARFRQETRVPGFDQVQTGEGQVWMLKPGMMRWDYTKPERQTIIANGETLWVYLPDDRQVIRDHINHSLGTRTPALFLAGQARLMDVFTVTGMSGQGPGADGLLQLELTPKGETVPYTRVSLGIDPSSYLVTLVRVVDAAGSMTAMWFSDIDTEALVAPSLFQFHVPPGVEVMAPPVFPGPR